MKMKYPNVKTPIKRRKMAGMYGKEAFLSVGVKPGFIKSHTCKQRTGSVPIIAINPAIVKYIQIISPGLVTFKTKSKSLTKKPKISFTKLKQPLKTITNK